MSQLLTLSNMLEHVPPMDGRELWAIDLSKAAVASLVEEAELTPKPALVDRQGNGAHHDLDLDRLLCSAHSLQEGLADIARAAWDEEPQRLREKIGKIG